MKKQREENTRQHGTAYFSLSDFSLHYLKCSIINNQQLRLNTKKEMLLL